MLLFSKTSTVTPTFYFIMSMRTISSVTEKNISRKFWLLFTGERDITGQTTPVQNVFPIREKKCRVFEDIFSGT